MAYKTTAPVLDSLDISLLTWKINGSIQNTSPPSIYRQDPSPEVDAAWARITNLAPIAISRSDVLKLGRDPSRLSKFPESFGLGSDAYIGRINVFHQIHCLDVLRKEASFNFPYYYGHQHPDFVPSELHKTHVTHCIYLLLQNTMCQANADIITHVWVERQVNPWPDFNLNHKCRDFEAVLKWQEDNSIDIEEFAMIRKPENVKPRIMGSRLKELLGYTVEEG